MSKYFTLDEMRCKGDSPESIAEYGGACGCNFSLPVNGMNERLMEVLDAIRETIGVPITVNCGYRCQIHNNMIPGSVPNSQHVLGIGADITYDGIDVDYLAGVAKCCGADGVGYYWSQGFVHVDTRGYPATWTEND